VVWLCKIAEISRAGYYKWKKNIVLREKRADRDADLKAHILGIHRLCPYFGYKRMRTALGKERRRGESQKGTPLNERTPDSWRLFGTRRLNFPLYSSCRQSTINKMAPLQIMRGSFLKN